MPAGRVYLAARRKRTTRGRRYRKKPMRKIGPGYIGRSLINMTYPYKQSFTGDAIVGIATRTITQTSTPRLIGCEFIASNLPNWGAFSALYDQYCITKIVVRLIPMVNINNVQPIAGASVANPGILATIVDTDDANAPASLTAMEQYQSYKSQAAISTRTHTRVFTPGLDMVAIVSGGTQVPATNSKLKWIDCSYGNVSHFGLKIYLDTYGNVNAPACYQIQGTMYIKFRNVR